jgi:hypothetical protein
MRNFILIITRATLPVSCDANAVKIENNDSGFGRDIINGLVQVRSDCPRMFLGAIKVPEQL